VQDPYIFRIQQRVAEAGMNLSRFLDPKGLLGSTEGPRHPLVILAFDEAHILTNTPKNQTWTVFSELQQVLHKLVTQPIFFLFLSTSGRCQFYPEIQLGPPSLWRADLSPLNPISGISFDDLALPAKEYDIELSDVVTTKWISHLGRPLYDHLQS
jgi:hypothetical protein